LHAFAFFPHPRPQAALLGAGACVNGLPFLDEALHDCLATARADGVLVVQASPSRKRVQKTQNAKRRLR
jgi:hypothetical protein